MPRQLIHLAPGEGRKDDIVIPIMGLLAAGKSSFVNNVLAIGQPEGMRKAEVSDGFKPCTEKLSHYFFDPPADLAQEFQISGRRIVLLDTPGFDDKAKTLAESETDILRRIADWLAASYDSNMKVGGFVYMYPIYPNRMTPSGGSNIEVFQKICGEQPEGLSKVILTTTRWDICPHESGEKRKEELIDTFWSAMLPGSDSGYKRKAVIQKLYNTQESAQDLIKYVLKRHADFEIDSIIRAIQEQIFDRNDKLKHVDAAQALRPKLEELFKASGTIAPRVRRETLKSLAPEVSASKLTLGMRIKKFLGFA